MLSLRCSRLPCSRISAGLTGFPCLSRGDRSAPAPQDRHFGQRPAAGAARWGGGTVMCAPSPVSRSPGCSLRCTPATIIMCTCASSDSPGLHHLLDYLPYICHSLWFLPQALLFLFQCHVCASFVFLILYCVEFIY